MGNVIFLAMLFLKLLFSVQKSVDILNKFPTIFLIIISLSCLNAGNFWPPPVLWSSDEQHVELQFYVHTRWALILLIDQNTRFYIPQIGWKKSHRFQQMQTILHISCNSKIIVVRINLILRYGDTVVLVHPTSHQWLSRDDLLSILVLLRNENLMGTMFSYFRNLEIANDLYRLYWILSGHNWLCYIKLAYDFSLYWYKVV